MHTFSPQQFVKKWSQIQLKERTIAQSHFNDVCALVGHQTPLEIDPKGEFFTFEAQAEKAGGPTPTIPKSKGGFGEGASRRGWADAWYKGHFVWEYKGLDGANLDAAYQQLLLYKDSLGNPPLLITSDTQDIFIHTNFTNTVKRIHKVTFDNLLEGSGLALLKRAFYEPESFKPSETQEQVTRASAERFSRVADTLQTWAKLEGERIDPEQLAHFIIRLLFCLFAEDIKLLPAGIFTSLVKQSYTEMGQFEQSLRLLFAAMRDGGMFGFQMIPHFNGGLFDSDYVPGNIPTHVLREVQEELRAAAPQDWSAVDPSIFGTLFERIIDESKRAQLGAHYTGKDDILLVIEPVLMQPLREKWQNIKLTLLPPSALTTGEGRGGGALRAFSAELASLRVLDPACGSGNFLVLALRQLLDLQKEVITFAAARGLELELTVSPQQLYGIEKNPYAHELAQITVWIGYLQWRVENGFASMDEPILKPLKQIENKDAILAPLSPPARGGMSAGQGGGLEPTWPAADVIIGNPPFLGDRKMRQELGNEYTETLRQVYKGRVNGVVDLACYWFEKARAMVESGTAKRVGLLATTTIRNGASRHVLENIQATGNIFWAYSDRDWTLDGATVHVSMVGFDNGTEKICILNGQVVQGINANLTTSLDLTKAQTLQENLGISFAGTKKYGPFDIDNTLAQEFLLASNPNGRPNSDVIKPWVNGIDITRENRNMWIIDFGVDMPIEQASQYEKPFEYVKKYVEPERAKVRVESTRTKWWLFEATRPGMRNAISGLSRFIVTLAVSKHRLFGWLTHPTLPDQQLIVIARDDDYFFGVLHSSIHELWSRKLGTQLRDAESGTRYTPTTTFETFPFPWPPGKESKDDARVQAIATAAKQLDDLRNGWLHPPAAEIGVTISEKMLQKRTLTNLYNTLTLYREQFKGRNRQPSAWNEAAQHIISIDEIETLNYVHSALDHAVLDAYGWPHNLSEEQILEKLLALNLERAKG